MKTRDFANGLIEADWETCRKVCAAQKGCLYFMRSDKKGTESLNRCYNYGKFGTYSDNFLNPYKNYGYTTWSNCGALFNQYATSEYLN